MYKGPTPRNNPPYATFRLKGGRDRAYQYVLGDAVVYRDDLAHFQVDAPHVCRRCRAFDCVIQARRQRRPVWKSRLEATHRLLCRLGP